MKPSSLFFALAAAAAAFSSMAQAQPPGSAQSHPQPHPQMQAAPPLHQVSLEQCPLGGTQAQAWLLEQPAHAQAVLGRPLAPLLGREVDWTRERLLVAATGQKPSLGYRVSLVNKAPKLSKGDKAPGRNLHYQSQLEPPAAGSATASALSRPCVLALLPRSPGKAPLGAISVQIEKQSQVAHVPSASRRPAVPPPAPMAL